MRRGRNNYHVYARQAIEAEGNPKLLAQFNEVEKAIDDGTFFPSSVISRLRKYPLKGEYLEAVENRLNVVENQRRN